MTVFLFRHLLLFLINLQAVKKRTDYQDATPFLLKVRHWTAVSNQNYPLGPLIPV
jgi:hypothetical protein